jgi:DNA-binding transcriptional regulator YiaG
MTPAEFRAALSRLGLSQSGFARRVAALGGEPLPLRTVQAWALGEREPPPVVPALLVLMERESGPKAA